MAPENTFKCSRILNQSLVAWALLVCLAFFNICQALEPAGHVLMVAGDASRVQSDGQVSGLDQGAEIFVGDQITTSKGSMLQLKMIDDALLILQADSQLVIEAYTYNPDDPDKQAAKITLNKGRLRSITGKLGESNHDAFRLNTPIAAIGIRGTDFEISTDAEVTRVRLNSGAIVLSAFNETCLPESLGPCQTENSLLLTEDLDSPVAELRVNEAAPRLILLEDFGPQASMGGAADEEGLLTEQRADDVEDVVEQGGGTPGSGGGTLPEVELPPDTVDKIHWGRWSKVPLEEIPLAGTVRGEDKETLFSNNVFVLYRNDDYARLGRNDSVNFMLYEAQAVLTGADSYQLINVTDGNLAVDFGDSSFVTNLGISSVQTGQLNLSASGTIGTRGLFTSNAGSMNVLGGFSEGGEQAGYLFDHYLGNDISVQGATQWVAP